MGGEPISFELFKVAVGAYCVALVLLVIFNVFRRARLADAGVGAISLGWAAHATSIVSRAIESGHWPLGDLYEYSTGISFVIATTCLVLMFRRGMRLIGLPAMMLTLGLLGVAYFVYAPPGQLNNALHSYWLTIHVTAMASASGILTFSFFFGMAFLLRQWADKRLAASPVASPGPGAALAVQSAPRALDKLALAAQRALPSAKALDAWSHRFVMLGFPIWTFGVICGAIWGEQAWGRYWGWDPKETFAFVTWVIFAIYLHARATYGWKGTRAAAITGVGMASILFTLYAVNLWIVGLHSYAGLQ